MQCLAFNAGAPQSRAALLDTIVVPRDLKQLPKRLPPPAYDSDAQQQHGLAARPGSGSGMERAASAQPALPTGMGVPQAASRPGSGSAMERAASAQSALPCKPPTPAGMSGGQGLPRSQPGALHSIPWSSHRTIHVNHTRGGCVSDEGGALSGQHATCSKSPPLLFHGQPCYACNNQGHHLLSTYLGSRGPSREGSRAPSPDVRALADNRKSGEHGTLGVVASGPASANIVAVLFRLHGRPKAHALPMARMAVPE